MNHNSTNSINTAHNNISSNTNPVECLTATWAKAIRYEPVYNGVYNINLSELTMDAASRSIYDSLVGIVNYCHNDIVNETQIRLISINTAELITQFFFPNDNAVDHKIQGHIAGMSMLFAMKIANQEDSFLFAEIARSAIDSLPDDHREFAENEANEHLINYGFKNVKRPVTIQSNDAFVTINKTFAPRPKPIISDVPLVLENVKTHDIVYSKSQAVLVPLGMKKMTVNLNPHDLVLFDQLHVAGKNKDLLQCEIREVVGAQNKLEFELLSVRLQPHLQAV